MEHSEMIEALEILIEEAETEQRHISKANYEHEYIRFEKYAFQSGIIVNAQNLIDALSGTESLI